MNPVLKDGLRALMPRSIRPHRILRGPLRGTWLVASWHDYPAGIEGRTERPLLEWFSQHVRAGETWLDVGARYGYTAFALARGVGPGGRVFAFEPVAATAGYAEHGRALNGLTQVTVLPFGLGSPDTIEMRRLPMICGMADSTVDAASAGAVTTMLARFDWLWPIVNGGEPSIHGVKIDVQGMELEALEGMREALARWRPRLVVELHAGVSRERALALLRELGYSTAAVPIEPARGEDAPLFLDDRSYVFPPA